MQPKKHSSDNTHESDTEEITIVGLGNVGSTIVFSLLHLHIDAMIGLFDLDDSYAQAQYQDLSQAIPSIPQESKKSPSLRLFSSLSDISDQTIIVIAAGDNQKPAQSRLSLIEQNYTIVKEVITKTIEKNPQAIYIVLTNPVDVILQKIYGDIMNTSLGQLSLPGSVNDNMYRFISTGTLLDTHRLYRELGITLAKYDYTKEVMVLGEHGDSQVVFNQTKRRISTATKKVVTRSAYEIIKGKGYTNFAVASTAGFLIDLILNKKNAIIPLSTYYSFESKNFKTALSLPIVIQDGAISGIMPGFDTPANARLLSDSIKTIQNASR